MSAAGINPIMLSIGGQGTVWRKTGKIIRAAIFDTWAQL